MFLAEIFFDRMAHGLRLGDRLGLALDPKPRLAARRIANVPHASSHMAFGTHRHRKGGVRCRETGKSGVRSKSTATWTGSNSRGTLRLCARGRIGHRPTLPRAAQKRPRRRAPARSTRATARPVPPSPPGRETARGTPSSPTRREYRARPTERAD